MTEKNKNNREYSGKGRGEPCLSKVIEAHLRNYFSAHSDEVLPSNLYGKVIGEIEKTLINETLAATRGNQVKAAQILGINRNTLRKKILMNKPARAKSKGH